MRLFQNSGLYRAYLPRLARLTHGSESFAQRRDVFLSDRFGACHFLQPVLEGSADAFFTNGDDALLQRQWAREQGMRDTTSPEDILLGQIEHHRTEVFYNLDPLRYPSSFVRRLPGGVRRTVAWRAAPSPGADFSAYDWVVCNFPGLLDGYRRQGWRAAWFAPAHDPAMDSYATNAARPVDMIFIGTYSRHHRRRAEFLEAIATLRSQHAVVMHLDVSRFTRLVEFVPDPLGWLAKHRRPEAIRAVTREPVFGRDLYAALSQAKIVLNGAIDMAGHDRGNMRCFEAMGCGCALLTDAGTYPGGMHAGSTMATYTDSDDVVALVRSLLAAPGRLREMADAGYRMISTQYSKQQQWDRFRELVL